MKGGKIGTGKLYYFLLPNNRSISQCAVFDSMQEGKMAGNKDN